MELIEVNPNEYSENKIKNLITQLLNLLKYDININK